MKKKMDSKSVKNAPNPTEKTIFREPRFTPIKNRKLTRIILDKIFRKKKK